MNKNIIEARKVSSRLINKSKNQAKKGECLWCGKKITRFCNSHSIPQCVLKNIDIDGKLDYFNSLLKIPLLNEDKGLNEAGTFKLLCNECDGKIFRDYEDINALEKRPSEKMLEEIALKNILMMLNKRYIEIELYKNLEKQYHFECEKKQEVNSLDEKDFWWDYNRVKNMMNSDKDEHKFKIIYWKKLDYKIPIAFQGLVALYGDIEGNLVTDIYNKSKDVIVKHMHLCMFPLKECSVVFAFYHEDDTEYDDFCRQFNLLNEEEKLSTLSYIVHEYSEDMLYSKKFPHRTWFMNKLKEIALDNTDIFGFSKEEAEFKKRVLLNKIKNRDKNFPCILSKKFSIENN